MDLKALIETEADQCVKCGLCLPRCPTYLKTRNEGDSPRGRIALLQGLAAAQLTDSAALRRHLEGCLACRACEAACPSSVTYGQLLDAGRSLLREQGGAGDEEQNAGWPWCERMLRRPRSAARLLRLYQGSGLQRLARASGLARRLGLAREDSYLPPLGTLQLRRRYYPATGQPRGQVALFTGCAGWIFDQATLAASIRLLTATGYAVHVPHRQQCCGALHLHRGERQRAAQQAAANVACFNALPLDAIIYTASGCGAQLSEYDALHALAGGRSLRFQAPLMEISHFLCQGDWQATEFRPYGGRAVLHEPCSLRHVLKGGDKVRELLQKIPALELHELPDNHLCCGAAGDYMFRQPAMADALLADKIEKLRTLDSRLLLTSNIGCGLHLQRGIRAAGLEVEVLHPVELLTRQLAG